jgi:hypothetical protein
VKSELVRALKSIANFVEKMKPKTLAEAEGMLALISVIASEALFEEELEAKIAAMPAG